MAGRRSLASRYTLTTACVSSWNHTHSDVGRSQSLAAGDSGKLAAVCQVLQKQAIQHVANQNSQLKFNILSYWQPTNLSQNGRDVLTPSSTSNEASCNSLHGLQTPEKAVRNTEQQWVAVFKAGTTAAPSDLLLDIVRFPNVLTYCVPMQITTH